jgi:exosortase/archaeosortase family protein
MAAMSARGATLAAAPFLRAPWPPRLRFGLLFGTLLLLLLGFQRGESLVARTYLYPMSAAAAATLDAVGVAVRLDADPLRLGYCILQLEGETFRVVHECTGIFTVLILAAAIGAYPARWGHQALGVAFGTVALFFFSTLRLVQLGVTAQALPAALDFLNLWLMSLTNLAFATFLWLSWIDRVVRR